ncbi:hypothetical protein BDR26DRAFT_818151 [Obelidium mucronatum]|nr:hypothetical protein BDR26DRAFT_818151 [Obelidium mucronatum]
METVLNLVEKHCGNDLKAYGDCIDKHQPDFEAPCQQLKLSLTKCAEDNVESVRSVKQKCAVQISSYEACVQTNPADTHLKCADAVKQLYACTHSDAYKEAKDSAHAMINK